MSGGWLLTFMLLKVMKIWQFPNSLRPVLRTIPLHLSDGRIDPYELILSDLPLPASP